ncbi:RNA-binding protein [bacterium]|nr:RNA-binding protein [bacterium]
MVETSELLAKEKDLALPGQVVAKGLDFFPGTGCYRDGNEIRSKVVGLFRIKERFASVIPLSGVYVPQADDGIIAVVGDIQNTFWILDINSPYDAILQLGEASEEYIENGADLRRYFDVGDIIYVRILNVASSTSVTLTMDDQRAKKLRGGRLVAITPSKISRLIGKEGSMIEMVKQGTLCQIVAGQNGIVWIKGENEELAVKTIKLIEESSHISGLTERIAEMLKQNENNNPAQAEK